MKRIITSLLAGLLISSATYATEKLEKITLAGPFAAVSDPLIRLMPVRKLNQ